MDLKGKLKTLIENQKAQKKPSSNAYLSIADNLQSSDFDGHLALLAYQARKNSLDDEVTLTKEAQDVLISTIEPIYFELDGSDVGCQELEKFPDIADVHVINGIRSRLRKQLSIVSKRVSDLIMDKQNECTAEMEKIAKLQKEACLAVGLCVEGRNNLAIGRQQLTAPSLHIVANHVKKMRILSVLNNLKTIRTLQMTDMQLQKLLKSEDYPGAIQLLLECQTAAATFRHFTCISELSKKLQDTLKMAEEQLESAVSNVVINFNSNTYIKLYEAYSLLHKRQNLMDQLHMHLASHIHNSAFTVILGYVELYNSLNLLNNSSNLNSSFDNSNNIQSSFSKMKYSEICKYVNSECFLPCYLDICKALWRLMRNYKAIIEWHKVTDPAINEQHSSPISASVDDTVSVSKDSDTVTDNLYIEQKLQHGLQRMWQDIQSRVRIFILASDTSHFKFDEFLKILDITNRIIEIGSNFCGSKSEMLQDAIKIQTTKFFQREHSAKLEELHMFLENEAWQAVPLKQTFSTFQLLEYRFLRIRDYSERRNSSPSKYENNLWCIDASKTPFDVISEEDDSSVEEDILAADGQGTSEEESDEDADLNLDYVDEGDNNSNLRRSNAKRNNNLAKMPVMTNTSLAILRLVGKYLYMMKLLQPIATEVFICLTQLVHYYLYTICHTFGLRTSGSLSPKLSSLLQRIEREIILNEDSEYQGDTERPSAAKVQRVRGNPSITEEAAGSSEALAWRVTACESLALLHRELQGMRGNTLVGNLLAIGGESGSGALRVQHFYATLAEVIPQVVEGVYGCVGASVLAQASILQKMASVSWAISSLESIHNSYVDDTIASMQAFKAQLLEVSKLHPLPPSAVKALWRASLLALHDTLLQGYASAKTCSNEGRSLMQLDYQQLTSKLEPLSGVRPLPGRDAVEGFIKAFYLPESALGDWVSQHRAAYTPRQLACLISVMTHIPKHARNTIIEMASNG